MENGYSIDSLLDSLLDHVDEITSARSGIEQLRLLPAIQGKIADLIEANVSHARFAGESWAEIGSALGISRQSAHERFREVRWA